MIEEIIREWLYEVTAVAMQFLPGTPEFIEWEKGYKSHVKLMETEADTLRYILNKHLGPNCKGCSLHGRMDLS